MELLKQSLCVSLYIEWHNFLAESAGIEAGDVDGNAAAYVVIKFEELFLSLKELAQHVYTATRINARHKHSI